MYRYLPVQQLVQGYRAVSDPAVVDLCPIRSEGIVKDFERAVRAAHFHLREHGWLPILMRRHFENLPTKGITARAVQYKRCF